MKNTLKIKIRPVTKSNWSDFKMLFESKGAPSYCWCMAWRSSKDELKDNTSENRKKSMHQRVLSRVPIGLLAYIGEDPIAWCSLAPRNTHERLDGDESIEDVWSITCFFIRRDFRGNGLTQKLISEAMKYARKRGAKFLEAYPVKPDSPSYRFMGFVETFEKASFKFVRKAGSRRHIMTHKL